MNVVSVSSAAAATSSAAVARTTSASALALALVSASVPALLTRNTPLGPQILLGIALSSSSLSMVSIAIVAFGGGGRLPVPVPVPIPIRIHPPAFVSRPIGTLDVEYWAGGGEGVAGLGVAGRRFDPDPSRLIHLCPPGQ